MEILIIAVLAVAMLVLGTLLVLALKRSQGQGLTQFEQRLADELRKQEKLLEERLAGFGDRVTGRLSEQQKESQTTLAQLGERLAVIDQAQKNITELSTQVVSLQELLSNKQARGAFGEEQLEALVRDLLPANYIEFQASLSNGRRVDCLLKLPAPLGPLAIDAKFPREAYDALRAAQGDPQQRLRAGQVFGQSVLKHVKDIAERYILPGETAEAALMFLPSEAVYAEIHDQMPDIADKARRLRVFIVSPTTLWAVLNTMRAILKDQRLQAQARAMQVEVQKLLIDVQRLDDRAANLEKHFGQVTGDVREIRISSGKVLSRGEKIEAVELEVQQEMLDNKDQSEGA